MDDSSIGWLTGTVRRWFVVIGGVITLVTVVLFAATNFRLWAWLAIAFLFSLVVAFAWTARDEHRERISAATSTVGPPVGSDAWLLLHAPSVDQWFTGTIKRSPHGTVMEARFTWPDGTPGTFTTDEEGAWGGTDSCHMTYERTGSVVTVVQPSGTRDVDGHLTFIPPMQVVTGDWQP
jgi:hypothetical protein